MNPERVKKEDCNKIFSKREDDLYPDLKQLAKGIYKKVKPSIKEVKIEEENEPYNPKKYGEKRTYSQDWRAYNLCQTNEFSIFQEILIELIDSLIDVRMPTRGKGRPFKDLKEMIFCCVLRAYFGKSSRRSVSFLDYAVARKFITRKPHFNTVLNYYKDKEMERVLKYLIEQSGSPLKEIESDFTIDASGFSTSLFGRWFDVRTKEDSKKRIFKKAHVTSGVKTNIISSIEITPGYYADSPRFCDLIKITAKNFDMKEISADKAYLARKNLETASELGAVPFIVFKRNSRSRARGCHIWRQMKKYYDDHHEQFMKHYHKRSNAETVFHMIKRKFGSHLNSKSEIGQYNEILCKALSHNICVLIQEMFELGINPEFNNCAKLEIMRNQV